MENYNEKGLINIGTGKDVSIKDLALLIKKITGYEGEINLDTSKPDGTPKKLLDVPKLHCKGWVHTTKLEQGIRIPYKDFFKQAKC